MSATIPNPLPARVPWTDPPEPLAPPPAVPPLSNGARPAAPAAPAAPAVAAPVVAATPRTAAHRRQPARRPVPWPVLAAAAVVVTWSVVVWAAPKVQVGPVLSDLARFGHLAALVVGFGAALTVEWFGLLWLLRRRPLTAVTQVAQGAHLPIWLGLAGLVVTGMMLSPPQLTPAGTLKLVAVLIVALNGIYAGQLQKRLTAAGPVVPRPVLARAAGAAMVSQLGWWGAVTIGFLSSQS